MRGARPQGALHQRQRQAFRFQRLGDALTQAVSEQRHQDLGPRIDPQALPAKGRARAVAQEIPGRQFAQQRFGDAQRQAGIAARHRVTDAVAFAGVEK